jgi:DNA replication protein DnaC
LADSLTVNKIFNEYEDLRTKASNERKIRMDRIYEEVPRIKEIDAMIYSAGFENMQNILKNPEKSNEYNKELKEKYKVLKAEKKKLIEENNIPSDYEEYKYQCSDCNDTGYTDDGKKCKCFIQKLINVAYSKSNLGDVLEKQNFETFSFKYYSQEKKNNEISPHDNMVKIYNKCKKFCDNFDNEEKSLFFFGTTGLGKTFLSSCIAKELIDNGKIVIYTRATKLFNIYEDYKFGRNNDKTIIDNLYSADLLIIDDLGTEVQNKNNSAFLFDLLCDRLAENKKMIISTNLNISEISKIYSSRFASRIYECFELCRFYGEDIRIQNFKEINK